MADGQVLEKRKHARHTVSTGLRFVHQPSGRDFPGRSVDVSCGGMLILAPLSAPVAAGQVINLTIPQAPAELAGVAAGILAGKIVRVDRRSLLEGHLTVAVQFQTN